MTYMRKQTGPGFGMGGRLSGTRTDKNKMASTG